MLDLYVSETCPYCRKVMEFLEENNISYNKRSVSNPQNLNMLLKLGGKMQVPFLDDIDNDVSLFESDDIIDYISSVFDV